METLFVIIFNIICLVLLVPILIAIVGTHRLPDDLSSNIFNILYQPAYDYFHECAITNSDFSEEKFTEIRRKIDIEVEEYSPKNMFEFTIQYFRLTFFWGLGMRHRALKKYSFYERIKHLVG